VLGGDVGLELGLRVAASLKAALGVDITPAEALIRLAGTGRDADFQCNVAMSLGQHVAVVSDRWSWADHRTVA
jgi:arginyl-tRNA synthetase